MNRLTGTIFISLFVAGCSLTPEMPVFGNTHPSSPEAEEGSLPKVTKLSTLPAADAPEEEIESPEPSPMAAMPQGMDHSAHGGKHE